MDAATVTSETICGTFPADHQRLEGLVEQILSGTETGDGELVTRSWSSLQEGLLAHFDAEETHLLPDLLRTGARNARVIFGEHQHLRSRLTELGLAVQHHAVRTAMVRSFIFELRAHARSEERLLYRSTPAITPA